MGRSKITKIDLNREYPCPCRRQGKLLPIILTEAMGCDSCQQIFVLTENGQFIQEVSSSYPYQKVWSWNGKRWYSIGNSWQQQKIFLTLMIVIIIVSIIIFVPLVIQSPNKFLIFLTLICALIIVLFVWLFYRR